MIHCKPSQHRRSERRGPADAGRRPRPLEHRLARWAGPPSSYQGVAGRLGHGRRSTPDQIIAGRAIAFVVGTESEVVRLTKALVLKEALIRGMA
jgi:hypothetical protein